MSKFELPPMATWLVYTDGVSHAARFGQFAMEQTFIVPVEALVVPEHVPIRVLEKICGKKLALSSLKGQPGQAKGLGKCSTWNISAKCKVFHVEHFVLASLCVPLCIYNRRNPERISRLSGAVSAESSALRDPSHSSKTR